MAPYNWRRYWVDAVYAVPHDPACPARAGRCDCRTRDGRIAAGIIVALAAYRDEWARRGTENECQQAARLAFQTKCGVGASPPGRDG